MFFMWFSTVNKSIRFSIGTIWLWYFNPWAATSRCCSPHGGENTVEVKYCTRSCDRWTSYDGQWQLSACDVREIVMRGTWIQQHHLKAGAKISLSIQANIWSAYRFRNWSKMSGWFSRRTGTASHVGSSWLNPGYLNWTSKRKFCRIETEIENIHYCLILWTIIKYFNLCQIFGQLEVHLCISLQFTGMNKILFWGQ